MLKISQLNVAVAGQQILYDINIEIQPGQVHAIMGPNGSGKSTLVKVLAGHEDYEVLSGTIEFAGEDITDMSITDRARLGLFLGFQYPVEIPGVSTMAFLKAAHDAISEANNAKVENASEFLTKVQMAAKTLGLAPDLLKRAVNEGFSGGEKKSNEILQMLVLQPKLAMLDEIDSGLDIDALARVAAGISAFKDPKRAQLMVTHYPRILNMVQPDFVHVLANGRLLKSGNMELANELEQRGYQWLLETE